MKQIEKNRFFSMADTFDKMAPKLVPQYDFLQDELFNIIDYEEDECINVVDLGAGSGILIEKILKRYPNSKCYWVDYSQQFLGVAKKKLSQYGNRVEFIISSFEDDWENKIKDHVHLVVSMSAIHHLTNREKVDLYKRAFTILQPNGWFVNIDEMKTLYGEAYRNSMVFWSDYVDQSKSSIPPAQLKYYDNWTIHFNNWKQRNIENMNTPKQKGDDLHESFVDQLTWLRESGFKSVDVFVKYHLWCIIGGQK
ncbi:class I SAM-dependent methyltransferase [Vallitalea okinawensis]|uniref:class I SAM-dependent methyltransferase n=1 Tax=Vallitalea okinawensis TaxID=2078660 RepID=UPI000CFABF0C|nr:class I SAM-dependent methyltransferase [Vallitalea okinawensis]